MPRGIPKAKAVELEVNPLTEVVEVFEPTKDIEEVICCVGNHPQLPTANYERKFLNKADAEAWMKRFNGKVK